MVFTMKYGMLMDFHGFFCQSNDRINRDMISNNAILRLLVDLTGIMVRDNQALGGLCFA